MTISATSRRAGPFLGNDSSTAFAFSFKVFSTADITVTIANSAAVETELVLDTDYTVTLNPNQDTSPGGVVTYPISGTALPTGSRLSIVGNLPYDQPLDIPAGGNFNPVAIENEFDRLAMQVQQLREVADRSITASVTSSVSGELPVPQAGYLLGWDQSNTAIINYSIDELTGTAAYATWVYDTFTGNGIKKVYTLQKSPGNIANCDVSLDGQTLVPITDFTVSGATLTFVTAPSSGAEILVRYGSAAPQGTYAVQTERKIASAGQTVVTLTEVTYIPGANNINVYVNGVRLSSGIDFMETSSTSITLTDPLALNDEIVCVVGAEISQAVDSANVGFLQSGTSAVSRTVRSKLRDTVSVKDFGAVGDGVTDDTAAIQAAATATGKKFLPSGTYKTTLSSASIDGTFFGDGQIRDSANRTRAPWFSAIKTAPSSFGDQNGVDTLFTGDLSKTQIAMEHRITGATTLGTPASGYLNRPEAYPIVGGLYVGPDAGYQASPSSDLSRTNASFQFVNVYHYGRGDGIALTANIFVAGSNSATDALAYPAGLCLAGQVTAGANDVNCNPIEINAIDNGYRASLQSLIGNVYRNNSDTSNGRYVYGARMQSQGTYHGDAAFSGQGLWKVGLDFTPLTTDTNKGAIAIKQSDRIYLNASSSTGRYVTSYGTDWIERNGFGVINFVVANSSCLQIGNSITCLVPTRLPVYTAATLPGAATGMECFVSDANSTTRGSTLVGGGANFVKVYYNGSNWIIA